MCPSSAPLATCACVPHAARFQSCATDQPLASIPIPNQIIPIAALGNQDKELTGGLEIFFAGESFVPAICAGYITFQLSIPDTSMIQVAGSCTLNDFVIPFPAFIKSINFLRIDKIALIATFRRPAELAFAMESELYLSTGNSSCVAKARDGTPAEAQCLHTVLSSEISIGVGEVAIDFAAATKGAWLDPLGLRNFAIVDPSFEIGVGFLFPCTMVPPICPVLGALGFSVTILWKRPTQTEWPTKLLATTDATGNKLAWPPNFIDNPGILTFQIGMLFKKPPHDDLTLNEFLPFAPVFCARLQISMISPSDIVNMVYDVATSMVINYNDVVADLGGTERITVALPAVDFSMVDEILPFKFSLEAEVSTSTTGIFNGPRVFVDFKVYSQLFGFDISFTFLFNVSPSLEVLFSDPMQLMRETGIFITADCVLPMDVGAVRFAGTVSPALFYLNASSYLTVVPGVGFDVYFSFEWKTFERTVELGFGGSLVLG